MLGDFPGETNVCNEFVGVPYWSLDDSKAAALPNPRPHHPAPRASITISYLALPAGSSANLQGPSSQKSSLLLPFWGGTSESCFRSFLRQGSFLYCLNFSGMFKS